MGDEREKAKRLEIFMPKYQVTNKLFELAAPNAVYMHCLPAHRGEEVTTEVIDGPRSIVFDQAENRLHAQKALLAKMMGGILEFKSKKSSFYL
jgi:ornithine carbamoyltransferase